MLHYNITVTGKVQGVWFRKHTQEKAQELGLTGFVMNQPNGTVYIEAEGSLELLNQLLNWLKEKGSPLSKVSSVNTHKSETIHGYDTFIIKC